MNKGKYITGGTVITDLKGYFKAVEIRAILDACKEQRYKRAEDLFKQRRDELIIKTGFYQARRVSEVVGFKDDGRGIIRGGLKPSDIDEFENKINWAILKKPGKPFYRAWKPAPKKLINELMSYIKVQGIKRDEYVFNNGNHSMPLTKQRVDQVFKQVCGLIGIKRLGDTKPHFHHLRHSWAYLALRAGYSERYVQKMLEHSSILITAGYGRLIVDDLRDAVDEVSGLV